MSDFDLVELTCEAWVGGERVEVREVVPLATWSDPAYREAVSRKVRHHLAMMIVDRWKPKITVRT